MQVTGIAAHIGRRNSNGIRFEHGAFDRSLADWQAGKAPIKLLDSHGHLHTSNVVGRLDGFRLLDDDRLEFTASLGRSESAMRLANQVEDGEIDGVSIGWKNRSADVVTEEKRQTLSVRDAEIVEVSFVVFPADKEARIKSTIPA